VDDFLRDGQSLLEAARGAAGWDQPDGPLAILVGRDGSIRAVAGSDWPLESLAAEYGARAVYRVSRSGGRVRVEGRSGGRKLVLEQERPALRPPLAFPACALLT
jgi:hypothetical protein